MSKDTPIGRSETYLELLTAIFKQYQKEHPEKAAAGELTPAGQLTPTAARELHEALCREKKMNFRDIIADWNRRSPDDEW